MASSNRHWPSMFKSKATCNTRHHHQWHSNDSNNLLSSSPSACHRSPYTSGFSTMAGCEDQRSPEPKPRWNPKPEQIRILESIFNSGMVNPPREEIRRIRTQLQEYGQVGDANVFYWFQNRKSRSKHKTRHLQKPQNHQSPVTKNKVSATSSSSSSEKSYSKSFDFLLNSPTASVNQHFSGGGAGGVYSNHHLHTDHFSQEPFYFSTVQQSPPPAATTTAATASSFTEGFCFSEFGNVVSQENSQGNLDETVGSGSGVLLTDLLMINQQSVTQKLNNFSKGVDEKVIKGSSYNVTPPPPPTSGVLANPTTTDVPSTTTGIQGVVEPGPGKSTVFINDVAFEVAVGPFNVREAFGDDAVLVHSYGQPVVTNAWGVTLQSLQHGSFYYLVRSFSSGQSSTIDLT